MAAAMMFAQPLFIQWAPNWKYAYTVGVSLGSKLVLEGFYLTDLTDHVDSGFTFKQLADGERDALLRFNWSQLTSRLAAFRAALVTVALQERIPPQMPRQLGSSPHGGELLHVLVADASPFICEAYAALTSSEGVGFV